jgi:hypothetical protein
MSQRRELGLSLHDREYLSTMTNSDRKQGTGAYKARKRGHKENVLERKAAAAETERKGPIQESRSGSKIERE